MNELYRKAVEISESKACALVEVSKAEKQEFIYYLIELGGYFANSEEIKRISDMTVSNSDSLKAVLFKMKISL